MSSQDHGEPTELDLRAITALSEATFKEQVLGERARPQLVLFWAPWSKDCEALRALLAERLEALSEPVALALSSVDIEDNPMLSIQYDIQTLPTLMRIEQGAITKVYPGYLAAHQLDAILTS